MNGRITPGISDAQLRDALTRRPDTGRMTDDLATIVAIGERTRQGRAPIARWLLVAAILLGLAMLLALLGVLTVGNPPRILHSAGPARTGLVAFDVDGHIWVMNADGSSQVDLTNRADGSWGPSWR